MSTIRILLFAVMLFTACHERHEEEAAVQAVTAAVADREYQQQLTRDEKQFIETLQKTQVLARQVTSPLLYQVANEFDRNYAAVENNPKAAGYPILKQVSLSGSMATDLVSKLADRRSYLPSGERWSSIFEPHHVLVLTDGKERITIVICVKCGDVEHIRGASSIGTHSLTPEGNDGVKQLLARAIPE